jgi:hypothetical protein
MAEARRFRLHFKISGLTDAHNIIFRYDVIPELSESSQADIATIARRLAGVPGVPLENLERLFPSDQSKTRNLSYPFKWLLIQPGHTSRTALTDDEASKGQHCEDEKVGCSSN